MSAGGRSKDDELDDGPPIQDPLVPTEEPEQPTAKEGEEASSSEAEASAPKEEERPESGAPERAAPARAAESEKPPIPDPLAESVSRTESERSAAEVLAARARWLSIASFLGGGLALLMTLVSLAGKADVGVVVSVLPMGVAYVVLGVQARRASATVSELARGYGNRAAVLSAVQELSKVFVIQLLATIFFVLLLVLALGIAVLVRSAASV